MNEKGIRKQVKKKTTSQPHVNGTSALKLNAYVSETSQSRTYSKINPLKQRLREEKEKINLLCTIANAFVIIATLGVCVIFLKTQFTYYELNNEIEAKKNELTTLVRVNAQMREDLDDMVNLDDIYEAAVTRLNMHVPSAGDVYFIESNPVTYTTKYASVSVNEEKMSLGGVLGYITRGW